MDYRQIENPTKPSIPPNGVDAFAVNFLWMAFELWIKNFPDNTKAEALAMAGDVTGKSYGSEALAEAFDDLTESRLALRAARAANQVKVSQ